MLTVDRGREISLGTALGELLHHRRHQPSQSDESTLQAMSEKAHTGGVRTPSHDSAETEGERKIGMGQQVLVGAMGWIWWGKPMWHDMGYIAVRHPDHFLI